MEVKVEVEVEVNVDVEVAVSVAIAVAISKSVSVALAISVATTKEVSHNQVDKLPELGVDASVHFKSECDSDALTNLFLILFLCIIFYIVALFFSSSTYSTTARNFSPRFALLPSARVDF